MTWWLPWHPDWYFNAGALLLAIALDAAFPEPPGAIHPVVWMGKAIAALERLAEGLGNSGALALGALIAVAVPALFAGAAWLAVIVLYALGDIPFLIGAAAPAENDLCGARVGARGTGDAVQHRTW